MAAFPQLLEQGVDRVMVRLDAGFNSGDLCKRLEEAGIDYVMRLKRNPVLEEMAYACTEQEGGHAICYKEVSYRARNWDRARRVVGVGQPTPTLFGRFKCHFLITSLSEKDYEGKQLAARYARRGKAERHFGEMKAPCSMALSSAARPKSPYRHKLPLCAVSEGEHKHAKVRPKNEAEPPQPTDPSGWQTPQPSDLCNTIHDRLADRRTSVTTTDPDQVTL